MKLAEKMNVDGSFIDRIVREVAVRTYMRITRPEFRPGLGQRAKWDCGKDKGRNAYFGPHRRKDGPSCCPITSSYRGFWGCPQAGGLRKAGIQK